MFVPPSFIYSSMLLQDSGKDSRKCHTLFLPRDLLLPLLHFENGRIDDVNRAIVPHRSGNGLRGLDSSRK